MNVKNNSNNSKKNNYWEEIISLNFFKSNKNQIQIQKSLIKTYRLMISSKKKTTLKMKIKMKISFQILIIYIKVYKIMIVF